MLDIFARLCYTNNVKRERKIPNTRKERKMKNLIEEKLAEIRIMNAWRTVTAISDEDALRMVAEELKISMEELKENYEG